MTDAREVLFGPGNPTVPREICDRCKQPCTVTWGYRTPVMTEFICHSCKIEADAKRRERKQIANKLKD